MGAREHEPGPRAHRAQGGLCALRDRNLVRGMDAGRILGRIPSDLAFRASKQDATCAGAESATWVTGVEEFCCEVLCIPEGVKAAFCGRGHGMEPTSRRLKPPPDAATLDKGCHWVTEWAYLALMAIFS